MLRLSEAQLAARAKKLRVAEFKSVVALNAGPLYACGLTLPWPPTGNHNVKHGAGGHYMTAKHKAFRAEVAARVLLAGLHQHPMKGRLRVDIAAVFPDKRRRDLDNIVKPILDALQHAGVYADDSAIDELSVRRVDTVERSGEVDVLVEMMP